MRVNCRFLIFLLVTTVAASLPLFAESDQALIARALDRQKQNDRDLVNYTCTRNETITKYGWFDRVVRHQVLSESYQTHLRNVDIVLKEDGRLLPQSQIDQQRRKALEVMQQDELHSQTSQLAGPLLEYESRYRSIIFSTYRLVRHMSFDNRRLESLNGRPTWKFDFHYDPSRPPQEQAQSYFCHLRGTLWIDQEDGLPVQVKTYLADTRGEDQEVYVEGHTRQLNGKWLRSYLRINPAANPKVFNGERFEWTVVSSNYQEFSVDHVGAQPIRE